MCLLTEVLGADPDGEVLLGLLGEAHALHDLLHGRVVAVLQLHGAVRAVHAVDPRLLILAQQRDQNKKEMTLTSASFILNQ